MNFKGAVANNLFIKIDPQMVSNNQIKEINYTTWQVIAFTDHPTTTHYLLATCCFSHNWIG